MSEKYTQHCRKEWITNPKYKEWLKKVESDGTKCFCDYCKCIISAKLNVIDRHKNTKKHERAESPFSCLKHARLPFVSVERKYGSYIKDMKGEDAKDSMKSTLSVKKKYIHKFQTKWLRDERFASWVIPCEESENDAFCTLCNQKISGGVTLLERHSRTKKHAKKLVKNDSISAHEVFPHFLGKEINIKTEEDEEEWEEDNYTDEDEYEGQRTANPPGNQKNEKLDKDTVDRQDDDEFDHFGRSIASQLRNLPEESAVSLISELQRSITRRRLKVIEDRESQTPSITSQVLAVSLEDNQSYTS